MKKNFLLGGITALASLTAFAKSGASFDSRPAKVHTHKPSTGTGQAWGGPMNEIYAVVVEGKTETPILMEAEGRSTSRDSAEERLSKLMASPNWIRGCVVRLEYVCGNEAVLHAMKGTRK